MVLNGKFLPIVDGVDELGQSGAALIAELNAFMHEGESSHGADRLSIVVTCREAEYRDIAEPLDEATHVQVLRLTDEEVRDYFQGSGIDAPDGLASILSNPLLLSMADTIFATATDNSQLIDGLRILPDEIAVERHVLEAFLDNAYALNNRDENWPRAQSERWLALIGKQMRELPTDSYAWRQLPYAVSARILGLLSGTTMCVVLLLTFAFLGANYYPFNNRL